MSLKNQRQAKNGYSMMELIVSIGIFSMIILFVSGSLTAMLDLYKKSIAMRTALDTMGSALESMVREIKTGQTYHCGDDSIVSWESPRDCSFGESILAFEQPNGDLANPSDQYLYTLNPATGEICKSKGPAAPCLRVTSKAELTVTSLKFYVNGTDPFDNEQPSVRIVLKGVVGGTPKERVEYSLQTFISQIAGENN